MKGELGLLFLLQEDPDVLGVRKASFRQRFVVGQWFCFLCMYLINFQSHRPWFWHTSTNATLSFVSTHVIKPAGYGRVVEKDDKFCIYEEKDCPEALKSETRVNAGIYLVKRSFLREYISSICKSDASGEFYITDLIKLAGDNGGRVEMVSALFDTVRGVNTLQELWAVEQIMRSNLKTIKNYKKLIIYFKKLP